MIPAWRILARSLVIAASAAVMCAGLLAVRLDDWPTYLVFCASSLVLFLPYVEVLPNMPLPIPFLAVTIGFLYIGGLPILVLANLAPLVLRALRRLLPVEWKRHLPQLDAGEARRELPAGWSELNVGVVAESAMFTLGLATRWLIVAALVPGRDTTAHLGAIALAEAGGYATWAALSILPIYPDRTLLPLTAGGLRSALSDIGLVVTLALTPFVFLVVYGFEAGGLLGAAAWSFSTLGLHFMLQRLHDRRTKLEEQNRRLAALNRELEHRERLSTIGKMSSVVSHQIVQQLGVIGLYADLIRNADGEDDPATTLAQTRHNASAIEDALGDVNRVLTDLLVFSKDLRLNLCEQPVARVIAECLDECHAEAATRRVRLRAECPADLSVTLDKLKIKQALTNIVRNALAASPAGDEVVIRARACGNGVEVAVADHGPGIAEPDRDAVFAPFFTTKEHGTGLGLAIAREFTEAHGGRLWVEPQQPGATFVLQLPRTASGAANDSA
jgi:signal transduction histidine kinase